MNNINRTGITLGKDDGTVSGKKIVCCAVLLIGCGKKANFADFSETNFTKNGQFHGKFMGIFWANFTGNHSVLH